MESKDSLQSFYASNGIKNGLSYKDDDFYLNNKKFHIFSGSLHYFRIHPDSWEESLKKMRHCRLNTVCTYVPWNLHEEKPGLFDFCHILDLVAFIELVKKQDMFLILRVGPYICAEIDFGGLPSWLLKDKNMKVRSNYGPYLDAVNKYFTKLISIVRQHQFSVSGGPIIAIQVENEFGSFGDTQSNPGDLEYLTYLKNLLEDLGVEELLFTCDMPSVALLKGSIPGVLMTANFQTDAPKELGILKELQPDKPLMVAELWSGWFDHWGGKREEVSVDTFTESLKTILANNASFNIYVFQGGTNFGFLNGANIGFPLPESPYCSTVTSYDYGALLTESGEFTEKYFATVALLKSYENEYIRPDITLDFKTSYFSQKSVPVDRYLPLDKMLLLCEKHYLTNPVLMEELSQRCGFILYETRINESGEVKFQATRGVRIIVMVDYVVNSVIENTCRVHNFHVQHIAFNKPSKLWLLVENLGRINFSEKCDILNNEHRGIIGPCLLNNKPLSDWLVYVLDFSKEMINDVSMLNWGETTESKEKTQAGIYSATFLVSEVEHSFLYSSSWGKGIAIINGFNIGRYWTVGPQQTLFIPKHVLKRGCNEILAFELHEKIKDFELKDYPILNDRRSNV